MSRSASHLAPGHLNSVSFCRLLIARRSSLLHATTKPYATLLELLEYHLQGPEQPDTTQECILRAVVPSMVFERSLLAKPPIKEGSWLEIHEGGLSM